MAITGLNAITAGLAGGLAVLSAMFFVLLSAHLRLKKRLDSFVGTRREKYGIETMLLEYLNEVKEVRGEYESVLASVKDINGRLSHCVQRVGMVRYNPFNDMGGDLSFALALLDEKGDGVVINSIRSRDVAYTYGKPVSASESARNLSEEEARAIAKAWGNE